VKLSLLAILAALAACGSGTTHDPRAAEGTEVETPFAEIFRIVERDGYHIVDIEASVVTWGG